MADLEYRCFIGGLSWSTRDDDLRDAFDKFGRLNEAKVVVDRYTGKSRGFGFVTFDDKKGMDEAIDEMNGADLDGRSITVDKAQPQGSRDRDSDRGSDRNGRDRDRGRDYGGGRGGGGGGGGDCFKCGKPGHFARECPNGDGSRGGGDRYGGREDRYGGSRSERGGDGDRYGGGGRSRDGGSRGGGDRDGGDRDRSRPYDRHSGGRDRDRS